MNPDDRIKKIILLEHMEHHKTYSEKIGIKDVSKIKKGVKK